MSSDEIKRLAEQAGLISASVKLPDAARAFSGIDSKVFEGVAGAFGAIDEVDLPTVRLAAGAFDRPIVAPQIAEAMKALAPTFAETFADARAALERSGLLALSKTVEDLRIAGIFDTGIAESLRALKLPQASAAAQAIGAASRFEADLAPTIRTATEETVALAEVDDVAAVIDDSFSFLADLTPAERRNLALDVATLVGAYIVVIACLSEGGYTKLTAALLAYVAALLRVYWRLTGKLK